MELASMLAGEPFSDHPSSTCPVIGAFLRAYNDGLPDDRRQDLYEYAAKVVGTSGCRRVRRARARMCLEWLAEQTPERARPSRLSLMMAGWSLGSVGRAAARAARTSSESHRSVLGLVDAMIEVGRPDEPDRPLLHDRPAIGGTPTVYVCRGFVCERPVTSVEELASRLGR